MFCFFSRLQGSYEALKGGQTVEAMEDFTGGLGEDFDLKKVRTGAEEGKKEMFLVIRKGLRRGDLMGCSITVSMSSLKERSRPGTCWLKGSQASCKPTNLAKQLIVNNFCILFWGEQ